MIELVAAWLGYVGISFVGAHVVAGYLGEASPYFVAGAAFAGHIAGAIAGMGYEKKWGQVTGVVGLILSALMIVAGASVLIERAWPLMAAAGVLASGVAFWMAYLSNEKRKAQERPAISSRVMGWLIAVPFIGVIALSVAVAAATGWY